MARITINGISFDPLAGAGDAHAAPPGGDASQSNYILIQTSGPLTSEQKEQLTDSGVAIHEYISGDSYLCEFRGTDLDRIRSLPFVAWADIYPPGFKVSPSLRAGDARYSTDLLRRPPERSESREPHEVDVVLHDDVDPGSADVRARVAAAAHLDLDNLRIGRHKLRFVVQERYLDDIASVDEVRQIEEVPKTGLGNNVAGPIIVATVVVNGTPYQGDDQVIAVADTGFDKGSTSDVHPAFTGRVTKLYDLGRTSKTDDPDGHGTHVAGSALGDGYSSTMGGAIQGTAPKATLVLQSLLDAAGGLGGIPTDLHDLFQPPYDNEGARVHTNSWYTLQPGVPYDAGATEIDDFVWQHQDMVILYCAGNKGTDANDDGVAEGGQIGSKSGAKNCVTVGASESRRSPCPKTYDQLQDVRFKASPMKGDCVCDNPDGLAAFSSRGPTPEGRIKPDVVAPGTCILSTLSRAVANVDTWYGTSSDGAYWFDGGTSMATPLTAGCAAVLRETLTKNGWNDPPAAVIKALLINGAVELVGQYTPSEAGPSPNNNSGWGRVNLAGSVIIPGPAADAGVGAGGPLKEGQEDTFRIHVPGSTFKFTLVWTDPPGAALQNDLDLIIRAPNGEERHGNIGPSKELYDRVNDIEQILWEHVPAGDLEVVIRAYRITQYPQPYAYAWRLTS